MRARYSAPQVWAEQLEIRGNTEIAPARRPWQRAFLGPRRGQRTLHDRVSPAHVVNGRATPRTASPREVLEGVRQIAICRTYGHTGTCPHLKNILQSPKLPDSL